MNLRKAKLKLGTLAFVLFALLSCGSDSLEIVEYSAAPDLVAFGLTANNELVSFDVNNPKTLLSRKSISGLDAKEKLWSIDFRPATGELYALSSASRIYVINLRSAAAHAVSTSVFLPGLEGTYASIDFIPTVDHIRLVSNSGQNLRLHPEVGALVAEDFDISSSKDKPVVSGIAYTNSRAGAQSTVLYDVDGARGKLYKQVSANDGKLVEVGNLGFTFEGRTAFDISSDSRTALLAGVSGNMNGLYMINLVSGKADIVGEFDTRIIDLAIPTDPVAYAVDSDNNLHVISPERKHIVTLPISGLGKGVVIKAIDFRPATGQLYALGSTSTLFTINLATGEAYRISSIPFLPFLNGQDFGFHFDSNADRIGLVSNTGQALSLDPDRAVTVSIGGGWSPIIPRVSTAAYIDNFTGNDSNALLIIDQDIVYKHDPAIADNLIEVGRLGIAIDTVQVFDIGKYGTKGYLIATVDGVSKLLHVDTGTGIGTPVMNLPQGVTALAVGLGF